MEKEFTSVSIPTSLFKKIEEHIKGTEYGSGSSYAAKIRADLASSKYCLANPGVEYLVYLPEGRSVVLNLGGVVQPFEAVWLDPVTGRAHTAPRVAGGEKVTLSSPLESQDALLHLKRAE